MRKEVKLGMALGGGLVALLIAYLIVAPPSDKRGVQLVTTGADGATNIIDPSAQSGGDAGATTPVSADDVAAKAEPVAPQPGADYAKLAAKPDEKTGAGKPANADLWGPALDKGKVEAGSAAKLQPVIALPTKQAPAAPVAGGTPKPAEQPVAGAADRAEKRAPVKPAPAEARSPAYTMISSPHGAIGDGLITAADRAALLTSPAAGGGGNAVVTTETRPIVGPELGSTKSAPVAGSTHVVRSGETFSSIAQAAYGSAAYYPHLIRANPNANPNNLKLGTVLVIPKVEDVKATGPTAPGGVMKVLQDDVKIDPNRQHRVQAGDSLYKISLKHYGTPTYLEAIYEKNRQQIGANPTRLKLGMILELPEKSAVADTTSALGGGTSGGVSEQH